MNLLAIECSSRCGSLALLANDKVLAECEWKERAARGQQFFHWLPTLCRQAGLELDAVDVFAIGRGPGDYSGLRMTMTAARAFALPGRQAVYAVSSGEALAWEVARRHEGRFFAVLGDARRDTLWLGLFEKKPAGFATLLPWSIIRPMEMGRHLPEGTWVASPDWSRLENTLPINTLRHVSWLREDHFPRARSVGTLAWQKQSQQLASEPLTPIYLHTAVARGAQTP